MRRFILPVPGWIMVAMIVGMVILAEWALWDSAKKTRAVSSNVPCIVVKPEKVKDDQKVKLALDCGGKKAYADDADTLVSYISNPGPLNCTLHQAGNATCVRK